MSTKRVFNKYPSPIIVNFDEEDINGEHVTRQIVFQPGEIKEIDAEDWEQMKDTDAIGRALREGFIKVDVSEGELRTARNELARNFLNTALIAHHSKRSRDMDMDEIGRKEEEQAREALKKIRQRQNIRL